MHESLNERLIRAMTAEAALDGRASATERRDPPVPGSSANVLPVRLHQVGPEAALDRLAGVTVDEIAKVIAFAFLVPPGAIPAAEAVLALMRARVEGTTHA